MGAGVTPDRDPIDALDHGPLARLVPELLLVGQLVDRAGGEGALAEQLGGALDEALAGARDDEAPAGGEAGGADAAGRQEGVGVELGQAGRGRGLDHAGDIGGRMDAFEVGDGGLGRIAAVEIQGCVIERGEDGGEPLGLLRMTRARGVGDHVGMGEQGDGHRRHDRSESAQTQACFTGRD